MAKWGEGDPRWIVEERPDATNVNNWHWTEKNAVAWSKTKLENLFVGLVIEDVKIGRATVTKLEKCEGDASVSHRKGRLFFFYEWKLKLAWKGRLNDHEHEFEGFLRVPNLSDENSPEDLDVSASVTEASQSAVMAALVRRVGCPLVRKQLAVYVNALKTEFTSGIILPTKSTAATTTTTATAATNNSTSSTKPPPSDGLSRLELGAGGGSSGDGGRGGGEVATITDRQQFKCTADELYAALTTPHLLRAFTGAAVQAPDQAEPGAAFSLLDGNVTGRYTRVQPGRQLHFSWRQSGWPRGVESQCVIDISQASDHTELRLTQSGVPLSKVDNTKEGWHRYYWDAMRRSLGFGVPLFDSM